MVKLWCLGVGNVHASSLRLVLVIEIKGVKISMTMMHLQRNIIKLHPNKYVVKVIVSFIYFLLLFVLKY